MADPTALDSNWLRANPLPGFDAETDKNARGRVLAIGGSRMVPGGLLLTAEAALRAGAGKVRMATVEELSQQLGLSMPEAAVIGLPGTDEGEIADCEVIDGLLGSCDAVVAGPAMGSDVAAGVVVDRIIAHDNPAALLIIDAAVLMSLRHRSDAMVSRNRIAVLTPHLGEMAALLDRPAQDIEVDRQGAVLEAARRYGAVVVLKGATSLIGNPEGEVFAFAGGGVGLATGGSGDVLAGILAALAARGMEPMHAALWSVWLHGEAGRRCAEQLGPVGFLARELLPLVPGLMHSS